MAQLSTSTPPFLHIAARKDPTRSSFSQSRRLRCCGEPQATVVISGIPLFIGLRDVLEFVVDAIANGVQLRAISVVRVWHDPSSSYGMVAECVAAHHAVQLTEVLRGLFSKGAPNNHCPVAFAFVEASIPMSHTPPSETAHRSSVCAGGVPAALSLPPPLAQQVPPTPASFATVTRAPLPGASPKPPRAVSPTLPCASAVSSDGHQTVSTVSSCPICLDPLSCGATVELLCGHTLHVSCAAQCDPGAACPVCRFDMILDQAAPHCSHDGCDVASDLWMCLTCGSVHCGRYQRQHAEAHSVADGHMLAVQLGVSSCVWDYSQNNFVHRLAMAQGLSSEAPLKGAAGLQRPATATAWSSWAADDAVEEDVAIAESMVDYLDEHYSRLLNAQLAEQLLFYEARLQQRRECALMATEQHQRRRLTERCAAALAQLARSHSAFLLTVAAALRHSVEDLEHQTSFLETTLSSVREGTVKLEQRLQHNNPKAAADMRTLAQRVESMEAELEAILTALCDA